MRWSFCRKCDSPIVPLLKDFTVKTIRVPQLVESVGVGRGEREGEGSKEVQSHEHGMCIINSPVWACHVCKPCPGGVRNSIISHTCILDTHVWIIWSIYAVWVLPLPSWCDLGHVTQ